jgi:hypothetical protein
MFLEDFANDNDSLVVVGLLILEMLLSFVTGADVDRTSSSDVSRSLMAALSLAVTTTSSLRRH